MQPIQFFAARAEDGALLPDATVDVFAHGTQDRAVLFSDSAGTVPLENPLRADANARVFFYSTTNRIDIRISRYGYVAPMLLDISTMDVATAVEQVRGEIDQVLDQARDDFDNLLEHSGYESVFLAYAGGVVVQRQTQLVQRDGELYRVSNQALLPLTLTGTWTTDKLKLTAVGDIALRQVLMSPQGAENVAIKAPGVNTVVRSLYSKVQREIELADYVPGGADDTVQFENMVADIPNKTTSRLITFAGLPSSYAATTPRIIIRRGDYTISRTPAVPAYFDCEGEGSIITQTDPNLDIFAGEAYQWKVSGFIFVGGRHHLNMHNANTDSALFQLEHNEHHLSLSKPLNTYTSGGVYQHMSANLSVKDTRFLRCNGVINNVCDSALFDNTWVYLDKANFTPNGGAFVNNGGTTGHARLILRNMFGVPTMGVGAGRVSHPRWIDNWGSVESRGSRFGGEDGGMAIVNHLKAAETTYPFLGSMVDIQGGWAYAGPGGVSDSGIVILDGHIPQNIIIRDVIGPAEVPYIVNPSSFNIPAYMAAWEAATGNKAYNFFHVDIRVPSSVNPDGGLGYGRIPSGLRPYLAGAKRVSLRRAAVQSIPNAFAVTPVQFDTVIEDNVGGFTLSAPTLLTMPAGCTRMLIVVNGALAVNGAAKTVSTVIVNNANVTVAGQTFLRGINPDTDRFSVSYLATGVPGQSWTFQVRHNAAGPLDLLNCYAELIPMDFV